MLIESSDLEPRFISLKRVNHAQEIRSDTLLNEVTTVVARSDKVGCSRVAFLEKRERCVGDGSREVEVKSLDVHSGAWAFGASRTLLLLR